VANVYRRAKLLERALHDVYGAPDTRAKTPRLRENHTHAVISRETPRPPINAMAMVALMSLVMMPCYAPRDKSPPDGRSAARVLGLLATLVVALLALAPDVTLGHAIVVTSSPAVNARVAPGTLAIRLQLNSRIDVDRSRLSLHDPAGDEYPVTVVRGASAGVLAGSTTLTAAGKWMLHWQVLSLDGHITRGEIPFFVGESESPAH